MDNISLLNKYSNTKVFYINKITNEKWEEWKCWKDCSEEEKKKCNLREIFPIEIVLDYEDKLIAEQIKKELKDWNYYFYNSGSRGNHIHLFFNNIEMFSLIQRNAIRKFFIKKYNADLTKSSENTLISIPDKPHFKTQNIKTLIDFKAGFNVMPQDILIPALQEVIENREKLNSLKDIDFTNYHLTDLFFKYISTNILPDDSKRNDILFPNISIALVKEGLTKEQIDEIMIPIIKNNFPGKSYNEFDGWLKKAFSGQISDYNQISINNWMKTYTSNQSDIYDLTPIPIEEQIQKEISNDTKTNDEKKRFITDAEFEENPQLEVEWLIDGWVAKGDICGIVGKMASFKTTLVLHMIYAIAEGKLIFNKYQCKKSKVLYLNEENHPSLFLNMVRRIKKGLDLATIRSQNVHLANMENLKLENKQDILDIINYVNKHKIEVIIFDSIRRFFLGKEDSADVISNLMNCLKIIRTSCNNCTIINIHHSKKGESEDARDVARGSSDWGNSLDSEIEFKRKINKNTVIISHIKNRSGPEINNKVLQLDMEDNKAYIWEIGDAENMNIKKSKPEECAHKLQEFLENNSLSSFSRTDLRDFENEWSYDTITKAIRILKTEGTLIEVGSGKRLKYSYMIPLEDTNDTNLKQQKL